MAGFAIRFLDVVTELESTGEGVGVGELAIGWDSLACTADRDRPELLFQLIGSILIS